MWVTASIITISFIRDKFLSGELKGSHIFIIDNSFYIDFDCYRLIKHSGLYKYVENNYCTLSNDIPKPFIIDVLNELNTSSILINEKDWKIVEPFIFCKKFKDIPIHYIKPETRINCLGIFI